MAEFSAKVFTNFLTTAVAPTGSDLTTIYPAHKKSGTGIFTKYRSVSFTTIIFSASEKTPPPPPFQPFIFTQFPALCLWFLRSRCGLRFTIIVTIERSHRLLRSFTARCDPDAFISKGLSLIRVRELGHFYEPLTESPFLQLNEMIIIFILQ